MAQLPCPLTPTATPLEPSVREVCQQRFMSIATDLSNMSLRVEEEGEGGASMGRRPHHYPPGTLESGEHFLVVLLQATRQLMAMDQVQTLHPFSGKVSPPQYPSSACLLSLSVFCLLLCVFSCLFSCLFVCRSRQPGAVCAEWCRSCVVRYRRSAAWPIRWPAARLLFHADDSGG